MFDSIYTTLRVKVSRRSNELTLVYRDQTLEREDHVCDDYRWWITQIAFAYKLVIDRKLDPYDPREERKQTQKARNVYEIVSPYGTRIPMLMSKIGVDFAQQISGLKILTAPFLDTQDYVFVFREDIRRGIHLLCEEDLPLMPFQKENILSFSNYAILHEGHRGKKTDEGLLYSSSDFRISGLLRLFPDFVYDIASTQAYVYLASPNEITILTQATFEIASKTLLTKLDQASLPWCKILLELKEGQFKSLAI